MSLVLSGDSGITFPNSTEQASAGLVAGGTLASGTISALSTNGITFPATQSASSDANTLDDYEEGTWTPTAGSGVTVVGTFSSSGSYIKVGRLVIITGTLVGSTSISCSATGLLTTVPFISEGGLKAGMGGLTNDNINTPNICWLNVGSTTLYATAAVTSSPKIWFSTTYITS